MLGASLNALPSCSAKAENQDKTVKCLNLSQPPIPQQSQVSSKNSTTLDKEFPSIIERKKRTNIICRKRGTKLFIFAGAKSFIKITRASLNKMAFKAILY